MPILNALILSAVTLALGALTTWLIIKSQHRKIEDSLLESRSQKESQQNLIEDLKCQLKEKEVAIVTLRQELTSADRAKAISETKLTEAEKQFEAQKALLEKAQEKLTTAFDALAGQALKSNNQAFLELARKSLDVALEEAKGEIGQKADAIKNVVKPLEDCLLRYEKSLNDLEKSRATAYGSITSQIESLVNSQQQLQRETSNLVSALRRPEVRGRWGELALKRVVELAGMTEYVDYTEQVHVESEEGRLRPDMIVHLPSEREIVVDSKVATDAYLDAIATEDPDARKALMVRHSQQVRKHMRDLSGKSYWSQFSKAPEFVVMFIPGESFLSAAVEQDPKIIEDGMENKVIVATPTTLIALLRAIAYGWRQEQIARHAQEIADLARDLYDRFQPFIEHVNRTGDYMSKAVVSFNKMIMSLERRVMVSIRKFKELGAGGSRELPDVQPIEQSPMTAQEEVTEEPDSHANHEDSD